jgi:pimeloyl-ACP methyl ester carboxylesterase
VPKIEANNLTFHYWASGRGSDLVLVHGLGGNLAGWHLTLVPELQREFRVLTYDLRGHGRSDAPPSGYTTADMAHDLRAVLDALGIEKAALVGHSWGGDIVLHFALLHPERAGDLVVVEGALLAPLAPVYRRPDWSGWQYVAGTIEHLLGRPIAEQHRHDLDFLLKQLIEIPILFGPTQGRPRDQELIFRVLEIMRPMWDGREADGNMSLESLSRIGQRTLLLYESNSVALEACRELGQRLPAAVSVTLPPGRLKHFTSLEHPDLVLSSIRTFLNERRASVPAASHATS